MKSCSSKDKVCALLLALALVITNAVPVNAALYAGEQELSWYDSIDEMLAAGEYEEGVVIAGIDMSKARKSGDPGSALESKGLRAGTEELISVDPEGALTDEEFYSWLQDHKDGLRGQEDGICITSIRRSDTTTARILRLLASDNSVVFAEPNYILSPESEEDDSGNDNVSATEYRAGDVRDLTALQWSSSGDSTFRCFGQKGNNSINVPGWPDGSNMEHEIIVAVMDYAVDLTNPDLADRAYTFTPELQARLGCDVHGFNATWESKDGKLTYDDDHGTHVAGIIGASWDGKGINGVGSNVRIVSVENMNENGQSSMINVLRGMNFIKEAKNNGVDIRIINNSWQLLQNSKALDAAVTELGENGVLTIFASGNDHEDINAIQHIQGTLADNLYVVTVASVDCSGNLADTSNYGNGAVTLAAPGVDILSTIIGDNYIPAMASTNTYYEDFESDTTGLKIYQADPETGEKVEGTDGVIVNSDAAMGFEGEKVIRVPIDHKRAGDDYGDPVYYLKVDFSQIEGLAIDYETDYFGFAFAGSDEIKVSDISGFSEWPFGLWTHRNSWLICSGPLKEMNIGEDKSLMITMDASKVDEVYFDTIGIGSEKHPYGLKSGTSMAGPAVTGAAAVIASRHYDELAAGDANSVKLLAGYVRSSVRPMPSLAGKVSTGGIIDLSVDEAAAEAAGQTNPDITDVSVSGKKVTLTGTGFGSSRGTVTVRKYISGKKTAAVTSSVSEWSDRSVTLTLGKNFEGIIEAELKTANGKKDTIIKFFSKSSNLFETDHNAGGDVGDVFAFDPPDGADQKAIQMGDAESTGLMVTLGGRLYYMPVAAEVEKEPAYRSLYSYDPDTNSWTACPSYPAWVTFFSGAAYDGKLYVKGTVTDVEEEMNIPYYADKFEMEESGEVCIYSYTPGDSSWHECSSEGASTHHTLFSTDDGLMLAGSIHAEGDPDDEDDYGYISHEIRKYDPEKGAGDIAGEMPDWIANPIVTYAFGHICICGETGETLYVMGDDLSEESAAQVTMPVADASLDPAALVETDSTPFSLAGDKKILALTWTDIRTGAADTYVLREGENSFSPYEKRVSDATLFGPSSVIKDGRLYVLSSSVYEPDKRLFRSTLLKYSAPKDKIRLKGTSLKKPKRAKKAIIVRWKKQSAKISGSRITGYQIQLATNKKFTKNKRTVTVKGYKKVSKKITKLKGGKKYYIRIRTYKTIKGIKYYSKWSKVRTVKTK